MREVAIIGVGAHATGQFTEKPLKDIAYPAIWNALEDAGAKPGDINVAYVGNSLGGLLTGQEGVRGQVLLQHSGITGIPIINVENACASAATALRGAWLEVASGAADVALAVGAEKMYHRRQCSHHWRAFGRLRNRPLAHGDAVYDELRHSSRNQPQVADGRVWLDHRRFRQAGGEEFSQRRAQSVWRSIASH